MNELQIFNNPEFGKIRAIEMDGEPWFVGKDVASALGYSNPRDALARHVDEEDKNTVAFHDGTSGNPNQTIINESGVYSLIFSSKLPSAKKFKRWVTSEVLPSIRKSGGYLTPEAKAEMEDIMMSFIEDFDARISALENGYPGRPMSASDIRPALPGGSEPFTPGLAARKRWMRTASEKLDLMSARFNATHNQILHSLYQHLEKKFGLILEEERLRAMEEHDLGDCSTLTAIFFNPSLRDAFEYNLDYNLAPENRGW